jgi:hypothetical protein
MKIDLDENLNISIIFQFRLLSLQDSIISMYIDTLVSV